MRIRRAAGAAVVLVALMAALMVGCGDDGEGGGEGVAAREASPPSDFPATEGRSLEQVLTSGQQEGPVVTPAAQVLRRGENRFSFGVFTTGREQITDADVAIYAAPKDIKGAAIGPFPARIEDLTTEPAFEAQTTSGDPDAAKVVYVSEVPLNMPGEWAFGALTKQGSGFGASLMPTPSLVGQFDPVDMGDPAPRVSTPTTDDVGDVTQIDTRVPPGTMHDQDLADVLGKKPVVLLFATPALCQSRICGPVVDVAEQVKRDHADEVAFIHQEVYVDNDLNKGVVPQMEAYRLSSEPWLYVIDRGGRVSTVIEGAYSVEELEAAVQKVLG
jgi:hypothetical protein